MSQVTQLNTDNAQRIPPLRVRQDQLHVFPNLAGLSTSKTQASNFKPRIFHYVSPPTTQSSPFDIMNDQLLTAQHDLNRHHHPLMCIGDKDISETTLEEPITFKDQRDHRLRKLICAAVTNSFSPSGSYICSVQLEGDIVIYRVIDRQLRTIKGLQKYEGSTQQVQVYVNDEASVIILRQIRDINHQEEEIWMWTQSKEQYHSKDKKSAGETSKRKGVAEDSDSIMKRIQRNTGMFRQSSYDRKSSGGIETQINQTKDVKEEPNSLKGSWIRVQMKEQAGPLNRRQFSIAQALDLRFDSQKIQNILSEQVRIFQVKLYTKSEYFAANLKQSSQQYDEDMLIELVSQQIKVTNANRGGNPYEACIQLLNLKQKVSSVEFIAGQTKGETIITKLDSGSQISFIVLNSPHMVYCQALFASFDTSVSVIIKLFDFVKPDDCPSFDNRGKTNLCIDDAVWTQNDAFVILIFNSFTFAILPRLGNSLISIFNPTISNISMKTVDLYSHYKVPRIFNELILPLQVIQKHSQIKQNILATRKLISMHPREESFLVTDGNQVCFSFRMDFEPELSELFGKENMSFFFVRFCISLERLVVDPEILDKIPQMLTNKLPLFEFDKNAELDEEEDPGQVVLTASQINPYEHGLRRMETNQSFNAEFKLDCQVVLLNLKHLLMSMRWNKSSPINYFQWIVTVVNDCFFYFLKNSEPVYAYHALRIGEQYCKKILFRNENDLQESQVTDDIEYHQERTDFTDFNQMKKFFLPVPDMYDYHNTKDYMKKSTGEKLDLTFSFYSRLPTSLSNGGGNWRFQFTKNYSLLVYYSLIQFRNYQAANFNILFLVFGCYIMQRYLDTMFNYHLQRIIEIVFRNFQLKKKSDDYELFLGKSGKNLILGPQIHHKAYQNWITMVMKFNQEHFSKIMGDSENMEIVIDTCVASVRNQVETVTKNTGYLDWIGSSIQIVERIEYSAFESQNMKEACLLIKKMASESLKIAGEGGIQSRSLEFSTNSCIFILAETLKRNFIDGKNETLSVSNYIQALQRMLIQTTSSQLSAYVKPFSKSVDPYFGTQNSSKISLGYGDLKFLFTDSNELSELLSILYLHLNDLSKASQVLSSNADCIIFKLMLLSSVIKNSVKYLDQIISVVREEGTQQPQSKESIQNFQMKASCVSAIRKALAMIKETFPIVYKERTVGDKEIYTNVSAAFSCLPMNSINILKEELLHQAVKNMSKILKFVKMKKPLQRLEVAENIQNDIALPQIFIVKIIQKDNAQIKQEEILTHLDSLFNHSKLSSVFYHYLHLALLCLSNDDSQQQVSADLCLFRYTEDQIFFIGDSDTQITATSTQQHQQPKLSFLMIRSFTKFSHLLHYISTYILHSHYQQQSSKLFNSDYLTILLKLSLFEKYQPSQTLLTQAFDLVKDQLQRSNGIQESELVKAFRFVVYGRMNRLNKQKMAGIMESVRQSKMMDHFMHTIENIMFSNGSGDEGCEDFRLNEKLMERQVIEQFNQCQEVRKARESGQMVIKGMRLRLLERCMKIREWLGISFDFSYVFDHSSFNRRAAGHILGVTDSIIEKYKQIAERRQEIKEKQRVEAEKVQSQPAPLSFREGNEEVKYQAKQENFPVGISLDSARQYGNLLESPRPIINHGRTPSQSHLRKKSAAGLIASQTSEPIFIIPPTEIAKNLMKSRQLGNPATPSRHEKQAFFINNDMQKLSTQINIVNQKESKLKDPIESVEQSKVINIAMIQENTTKRKNSVRRQLGIGISPKQDSAEVTSLQNKVIERSSNHHRKGQMSMAVGNGTDFGSFNFGNQKNNIGLNKNQPGQTTKNILHPPGLPKPSSGSHSKRRVRGTQSKTEALQRLIKSYENQMLRLGLITWKQALKNQGKHQSAFNIMIVKKEGESYSVQELRDLLSKQKLQQQIVPTSQEANLITKPFEFLTMKDGKIQSISQPPQIAQNTVQAHKKSKMTKDQKLSMMKKFRSISDKLDKVQREAEQLNKDFSRLNQ